MKERATIIVTHVFPPIPLRQFDYQAVRGDYEPGMALGHGATEEEAIQALLDEEEFMRDWQEAHDIEQSARRFSITEK